MTRCPSTAGLYKPSEITITFSLLTDRRNLLFLLCSITDQTNSTTYQGLTLQSVHKSGLSVLKSSDQSGEAMSTVNVLSRSFFPGQCGCRSSCKFVILFTFVFWWKQKFQTNPLFMDMSKQPNLIVQTELLETWSSQIWLLPPGQ